MIWNHLTLGPAMIFRQLFDSVSGTYSYLLASRPGGEALILDPVLEKVDRYCQLLRELDLKLVKAVDTHLHADHMGGFFMLLQGFWLEKRQKELHVHLPGESIQPLRQMLQASFLFEELLPFEIIFSPWVSGETVLDQNVRITPFPTTHLQSLKKTFQAKYPGEYAAYCFLLESERGRIGHSADLGAPQDLEPLLAKPLELLVCEVAHFKPEDLFRYLQGRDIKRIAFTHIGRYYWEHLEETRRLAARFLPNMSVSFPRDLDVLEL